MSQLIKNWRFKRIIRNGLQKSPRMYYSYLKYKSSLAQATTSETQIVIEGSPRTANTFMVEAFRYVQKQEIKIAHHLHVPVQLIQGMQLGIPCIVLIREPAETAISHAIAIESDLESLLFSLNWFIDFYEPLLNSRQKLVVADFKEIISDPKSIIDRVNKKFLTKFDNFSSFDKETGNAIKARIDEIYLKNKAGWFNNKDGSIDETKVSRPSEKRAKEKEKLKELLENEKIKPLLEKAQNIYKAFFI